jgi:hypothetical protein
MSADRVHGITARVEAGTVAGVAGQQGIGGAAALGPDGELLFGLSIVHEGGAVLTAVLDEAAIDRLANMMADYLEALPAVRSEVRH